MRFVVLYVPTNVKLHAFSIEINNCWIAINHINVLWHFTLCLGESKNKHSFDVLLPIKASELFNAVLKP